jgi:hypothetical protein
MNTINTVILACISAFKYKHPNQKPKTFVSINKNDTTAIMEDMKYAWQQMLIPMRMIIFHRLQGQRSKVEGPKVEGQRSKVESRRSKSRRSKVESRRSKVKGQRKKTQHMNGIAASCLPSVYYWLMCIPNIHLTAN